MQRVRINVGSREVVNSSGQLLSHLATLLDKVAPPSSLPTATLNAAHVCTWELPIYFAFPNSLIQEATLLASHGKLNPQVIITYGDRTALYTGGGGTVTLSAESCVLSCEFESAEVDPALYSFIGAITTTISAAQADLQIDLPFADKLVYRGMLLMAIRAGARSDTEVTRVRVKAGESIVYDAEWSTIQAETRRIFGVAPPAGVAMIWFDQSHRLQRLLDTSMLGSLKAEIETIAPSGTTNFQIVPLTVRPIEKVVAAA
jgi:hypothetical protein